MEYIYKARELLIYIPNKTKRDYWFEEINYIMIK